MYLFFMISACIVIDNVTGINQISIVKQYYECMTKVGLVGVWYNNANTAALQPQ